MGLVGIKHPNTIAFKFFAGEGGVPLSEEAWQCRSMTEISSTWT